MSGRLSGVLGRFMQREQTSASRLANLSGVAKKTITNWLEGSSRRPQRWQGLIRVAAALHLSESEATTLLLAGGHASLAELRTQITTGPDRSLLEPWPISRAPFQAIADLPYFVGREHELAHLRKTLLGGGFVTICNVWGMGGVGKTSLAAHLAYQLRLHFPDGVLWARLDTTDTLSILSAFAAAYDHDVSSYIDLESRSSAVRALLADKRVLIVLDNAQNSAQVRPLLPPTTGRPAVIITTRHDLEIADHTDRLAVDPFDPESGEALLLFTRFLGERRVRQFRAELLQIAEVVGHLPLALALVAGRLVHLSDRSVGDFLDQLRHADQRLNELAREDRSVRLSFNASYAALSPDLQQFFITLSAFGGENFSVEAAAYVTETASAAAVNQLDQLVRLSLVQPSRSGRYRLHPLLRDYAREKINADACRRMADFFVQLVEAHQPDRIALEQESANVIAALEAAYDSHLPDRLIRGTLGMYGFWESQGLHAVAIRHLERAYECAHQSGNESAVARTALNLGKTLTKLGKFAEAETCLMEGLQTAQHSNLAEEVVALLTELGGAAIHSGDYPKARQRLTEALDAAQVLNQSEVVVSLYYKLGILENEFNRYTLADEYFRQGLAVAEVHQNLRSVSMGWNNLFLAARKRGDYALSEQNLMTSLTFAHRAQDIELICGALLNLGLVAHELSQYEKSAEYLRESLTIARRLHNPARLSAALLNLGVTTIKLGAFDQAEVYLKEALEVARAVGYQKRICAVLYNLAALMVDQRKYEQADTLLREGVQLARAIQQADRLSELLSLSGLVSAHLSEPRLEVEARLDESLALAHKTQIHFVIHSALVRSGEAYALYNARQLAAVCYFDALELARRTNSPEFMAEALFGLAQVSYAEGRFSEAERHSAESLQIFETIEHHRQNEVRAWQQALASNSRDTSTPDQPVKARG